MNPRRTNVPRIGGGARPGFAVLAAAALVVTGATARAIAATAQEGLYEVTRSQMVVPAPKGMTGRKTIDRETRVGNTAVSEGKSSSFVMTLGGFVKKCPIPDPEHAGKFIVPADFEFSVSTDEVNTQAGNSQRTHNAKRAIGKVKAHLKNDATINELEIETTFTTDVNGVQTAPTTDRRRFKLGAGGMPNMEALKEGAVASGDMSVAAMMWNASETYSFAQLEWLKPNACVEVAFDPPSDDRTVGPNETTQVRATLRTIEGKHPVGQAELQGQPLNGIGQVSPRKGQTADDGAFDFKYTASSSPKDGHGLDVASRSPAGPVWGNWRIRAGGDYELHFESSIISRKRVQSVRSQAKGSARLTGSDKPWKLKPDGKKYRLYDGSGAVQITTQPGPERDTCDPLFAGSSTSQLQVVETYIQITPPAAGDGAPAGGKADIVLAYSFSMAGGETETEVTYVDFKCVPRHVHPLPYWWMAYGASRGPKEINFLRDWEYVGRDVVVARKVLTGNCGGLCDEERSVFTLKRVETKPGAQAAARP